ncbi:MAG: hypothetical protein LBC75_05025 [Fibromonadaceae bacterium]|jgi:hypothetical protein|nr:hypothetical protein [Fibromonadaceae bacterium]
MKKMCILSLCLALLMLAACGDNLFGSSSSDNGDDVKSLRIDAENAFRKGNYKKSYEICEKIVKKDPTSSFGYYGMAKASLWWNGVNPFSVFSLVKPKEGECPFMGEDVKVRNNFLQAMKKIVPALSELDRRDSLTALYEFHMRAKENKSWDTTFIITNIIDGTTLNLSLNERLLDFRKTFCNNSSSSDCSDTTSGGKKKPFPLSDREYKSGYFGGILLLSSFSRWFLNFFDFNNDGCITKNGEKPGIDFPSSASEWEKWGCEGKDNYDMSVSVKCPRDPITGEMSVVIDSKQILEDLEKELQDYYKKIDSCTEACETKGIPNEVGSINDKIDDLSDAFGDIADLLDGLGIGGGDPDIDQGSIREEIDKYKAYASFYKMGTHYDEDGDGCVDEELIDGQDNDGDGFVNENSRLAPIDPDDKYYGLSPMNNSMWGSNRYKDNSNWEYNKPVQLTPPVRICNAPDCSIFTELPAGENGLVTVINFTQKLYPDGKKYWTTRDANLKLEVAQDKSCSKYGLEYRKQKIGGCWPYYDQNKFKEYCKES